MSMRAAQAASALVALFVACIRCTASDVGRPSVDAGTRTDAGESDAAGGCGRACRGDCVAGRCLVTLATPSRPAALALADAYVYFGDCTDLGLGTLSRVSIAGGPFAGGLPVEIGELGACPGSLAVGDDGAYVAVSSGIARLGTGRSTDAGILPPGNAIGSGAYVGATGTTAVGIALDANDLYFTTATAVGRIARAGGAATTLASFGKTTVTRPLLDAENVYWGETAAGTIHRVAKRGGDVTALGPRVATVRDVALYASDVYLAGGYTVQKVPLSGGSPTTLGTADGAEVLTLAADESGVYFTSSGAIWKLPPEGGTPVALASGQDEPFAIATDATSVYWMSAKSTRDACCGRVVKLTPK